MISKALVVSLKDSDRKEGFFASPWGISFEVFDAVDTRNGIAPEGYNLDAFVSRYGVNPRPGEIGCAMSHATIIREFAAEPGADTDLLLVAEDDARAVEGFESYIQKIIGQSKNSIDLILLSEPIFGSMKNLKYYAMSPLAKRIGGGHRIGKYFDKVAGNGLYLISRGACKKFSSYVESHQGVGWLADEYSSNGPFANLDIKVVRPGLADWEGETTIQDKEGILIYNERKIADYSISFTNVYKIFRKGLSKVLSKFSR